MTDAIETIMAADAFSAICLALEAGVVSRGIAMQICRGPATPEIASPDGLVCQVVPTTDTWGPAIVQGGDSPALADCAEGFNLTVFGRASVNDYCAHAALVRAAVGQALAIIREWAEKNGTEVVATRGTPVSLGGAASYTLSLSVGTTVLDSAWPTVGTTPPYTLQPYQRIGGTDYPE